MTRLTPQAFALQQLRIDAAYAVLRDLTRDHTPPFGTPAETGQEGTCPVCHEPTPCAIDTHITMMLGALDLGIHDSDKDNAIRRITRVRSSL